MKTSAAALLIAILLFPSIAYADETGSIGPALGGLGSALGGLALLLSMLTRTRLAERISTLEATCASLRSRFGAIEERGSRIDRDLAVISTKLDFVSRSLDAGD